MRLELVSLSSKCGMTRAEQRWTLACCWLSLYEDLRRFANTFYKGSKGQCLKESKVWTRADLACGDELLWCGVPCLAAAIDTEKMHGKLQRTSG